MSAKQRRRELEACRRIRRRQARELEILRRFNRDLPEILERIRDAWRRVAEGAELRRSQMPETAENGPNVETRAGSLPSPPRPATRPG
jgi:hypothetical protein